MLQRCIKYICVALLAVTACSKGFAQTADTTAEEDYLEETDTLKGSRSYSTDKNAENNFYYNKAKFNAKSDTVDPITQRNFITDTINKLKSKDEYWYANTFPEKEKKQAINKEPEDNNSSSWESLKWILMSAVLIVLVILFLINANIKIFASSSKKIIRVKNDGEISDDIFEIDFEKEITKAKSENNFRLATRLLFLRLIKSMSQKSIIEYKIDKTNFDYLFHLSSSKYYNEFAVAVKNYEYTWYGKFELTAQQFATVETNFKIFQKQIDN
jgi:hypothetical protein